MPENDFDRYFNPDLEGGGTESGPTSTFLIIGFTVPLLVISGIFVVGALSEATILRSAVALATSVVLTGLALPITWWLRGTSGGKQRISGTWGLLACLTAACVAISSSIFIFGPAAMLVGVLAFAAWLGAVGFASSYGFIDG